MTDRIVLAYSGDLDTTVAIPWLSEHYEADVIAVTLDLGQGNELEEVRARALATGAIRAHVLDVRDEFARQYLMPALQAGALFHGGDPLCTALGRPLIAKKLIEIADIEQAAAIAHGCTGKDNGPVGIEVSARSLRPDIQVIAPAYEWGMTTLRELEYARQRGVPVPATLQRPYSVHSNLWGRSVECGPLTDLSVPPPADLYTLTTSQEAAPNAPAYVEIAFEQGVPVSINGVLMRLTELIESLSIIAGQHGVGRLDTVENQGRGTTTRMVFEAPAAIVLHAAHHELEMFAWPKDLARLTRALSLTYADLVYDGLWFSPMREALDAFYTHVQQKVTGAVRLKLFKGQHTIVGRTSPHALSDRERQGTLEAEPVTQT